LSSILGGARAYAPVEKQSGKNDRRIFKKDPIRLSPNMSGNEFAAVVATVPEADRQAVGATVRQTMLHDRDR